MRKIRGMKSLRALVCAAAFSFTLFADHSAVTPAPRGDQGWKTRAELLNQRVKENKDAQLLFIGDSITQGWEGDYKRRFRPIEAYGPQGWVRLSPADDLG